MFKRDASIRVGRPTRSGLPLLFDPEAALLARLAQRAFAERGLETLYDGAGP